MKQAIIAWLWRVFAWLSQGVNVIFLGGHEDETVSARAYRQKHFMRWLILYQALNLIFFWQEDHCQQSYDRDVQRANQIVRGWHG